MHLLFVSVVLGVFSLLYWTETHLTRTRAVQQLRRQSWEHFPSKPGCRVVNFLVPLLFVFIVLVLIGPLFP